MFIGRDHALCFTLTLGVFDESIVSVTTSDQHLSDTVTLYHQFYNNLSAKEENLLFNLY